MLHRGLSNLSRILRLAKKCRHVCKVSFSRTVHFHIIYDNDSTTKSLFFIHDSLIYSMAYYTTVQKVYSLYPRVGSLSSVNSSAVSFYIDQAENEINGYLINNYTLPFSSTPPIIESLSTEYALVKILERFFTQEIGSDNRWVENRHKYVKEYLSQINSGDVGLYNSSLEIIAYKDGDAIFSNTMNYNPTFNVLNPTLQQIDGDRLEDEWDDVKSESYKPNLT